MHKPEICLSGLPSVRITPGSPVNEGGGLGLEGQAWSVTGAVFAQAKGATAEAHRVEPCCYAADFPRPDLFIFHSDLLIRFRFRVLIFYFLNILIGLAKSLCIGLQHQTNLRVIIGWSACECG